MDNLSVREKLAKDYRHLIEVRAAEEGAGADDGYFIVEGVATPFNTETVLFEYDGVKYLEEIKASAFDSADMSDVVFRYNHSDTLIPMARTRNKTLDLTIKESGLHVRARLDKRVASAVELYQAIKSGLIDRMSFAFRIGEESYDEDAHKWTVLRISKVFDVAAVDFPAYETTELYARRQGELDSRAAALESEKRAKAENDLKLAKMKVISLIGGKN